jgi:hypothetical protein
MGKSVKYIETIQSVLKHEGASSLYKGAMAAGTGSIIFRATGFSTFELFFTKWESNPTMR